MKLCDDLPIKTVARQIAEDYPGYFSDTEAARSAIRTKLGANGEKSRVNCEQPKHSTIAEGIAKLKKQDVRQEEILRFRGCKALILADVHIPYHDADALALAVEYGHKEGCDVVILNGDILDFYGISRFGKEIGRMTVYDEIQVCKEFLSDLRSWFPDARIVFKMGNHEVRLRRYLTSEAKEIADIPALALENLLGLEDLDIKFVAAKPVMLGKLAVLHGHELPMGILGPVNPARGLFLKTRASTIAGHWHFTSEHGEPNLHREETACWSTGCLCDLQPEYSPNNRWNHGFATVEVDDDGMFTVHNHRIVGGRVR